MPFTRYSNRRILRIDDESYMATMENRRIKHFDIHETPQMSYPTAAEMANLDLTTYIWKDGDRLTNLAYHEYGNPKLWWVIARFNSVPTEAMIKMGDVIYVPKPLELVLSYMRG